MSAKPAKLLNQLDFRIQLFSFISCKKISLRCAKVSFFPIFLVFQNFRFWRRNCIKPLKKIEFGSRVRFFGFLSSKRKQNILTQFWGLQPKSPVFWVFFQKTIFKVKIIDLKKFWLYKVSSEVTTYVRNSFYPEISKWE